eukprot:7839989-Heterocapsa_arctica.AAC.1
MDRGDKREEAPHGMPPPEHEQDEDRAKLRRMLRSNQDDKGRSHRDDQQRRAVPELLGACHSVRRGRRERRKDPEAG